MYNIKLLNKISNVGLKKYDTSKYVYGDDVQNPDAVMVRSASMHDMQMPRAPAVRLMQTHRPTTLQTLCILPMPAV